MVRTFLESAFLQYSPEEPDKNPAWIDQSTNEYHVFSSDFGYIRLRRRDDYPSTFAFVRDYTLFIGYGDPSTVDIILSQPLDKLPEAAFYDREFLFIAIDSAGQTVTIQRDAFSTLPAFACTGPGKLFLSNRYERVYEMADPRSLTVNHRVLARLVSGEHSYTTLFNEIVTLYDRMRGVWTSQGWQRLFPPDGSIKRVAADRDGDPKRFFGLLENTLDAYWQRYAGTITPGLELSGGIDSSTLAGYYARSKRKYLPSTMTYSGNFRQSVQHKLEAMESQYDIISYQVPMFPKRDFPLAHKLHDGRLSPFYIEDELYFPAIDKMAEYFRSRGASVVFRGIGGDELFENYPDVASRHGPGVPVPLLSGSVATSGLGGNNVYLDRGIWPVMPLADPKLYLYCQSLPMRYRYERNILRAYLHARGYPESIHSPSTKEHFGNFFVEAILSGLSPIFNGLMRNSVLAAYRLIDADACSAQWQNMSVSDITKEPVRLFNILKAEASLQDWRNRLDSSR